MIATQPIILILIISASTVNTSTQRTLPPSSAICTNQSKHPSPIHHVRITIISAEI
jgi:hypothetical protein